MSIVLHMLGGRRGKSIGSVAAIAPAALTITAAPASAHRVTSAVPNCTSVHLVYESTQGTTFSGTVFVDNGTVAAKWSHVAGVDVPVSGAIDVPYAHPAGPFTMYVQWHFSTGESSGLNRVAMDCPPAAPPPRGPGGPRAGARGAPAAGGGGGAAPGPPPRSRKARGRGWRRAGPRG